ncbi:Zinc finger C3H1 domain-containing protein [Modicella reniformis]|uniref:Zinc finger C3H1 domain-containing protein n=1 Tax=Modicella reniformis TaxID=1440133 RepID=A0A9P6MIU2_9FUNG|nr:Zinc finger C3H1 domain-containing protein [Modicella reniformis]
MVESNVTPVDTFATWNHGAEATYTTKKFQDLSISPCSSTLMASQVFPDSLNKNSAQMNSKADELPSSSVQVAMSATPSSVSDSTETSQHMSPIHQPPDVSAQHPQALALRPPPPPTPPYVPPIPPPPPPPPPPIAQTSPALSPDPDTTSENGSNVNKAMDTTKPKLMSVNNQATENGEVTETLHLDSASKDPREVDSNTSQDDIDMDMDMDMDLDDGTSQSTILKGSWKTTEDPPALDSEPVPCPVIKKPSLNHFGSAASPLLMQINSAPASMASTPTRQQDNADLQPTQSFQRQQWNGKRATALDFIPKTRQQTPFIQERALSYLIDLDDEDGDEPGGDAAKEISTMERPSALKGRVELAKKSTDSQSLEDIQRKLKVLNDLIKTKEMARLSMSSKAAKSPIPRKADRSVLSQSASNSPVQSPGMTSHMDDQLPKPVPEAHPDLTANDDILQLRRSLSGDTTTLERLRSQLQECEKESSAASSTLEKVTPTNKDEEQGLEAMRKTISLAQETVETKERELQGAKHQLEETRARIEPMITRLMDAEKTREKLRKRVKLGQEKSISLKSSIANLQQDIIRKRTRLMIIESGSATPTEAAPVETTQAQLEKRTNSSESAVAVYKDSNNDSGSKRELDSIGRLSPPVMAKKPCTQARQELTALTKRMQELARERELLQSGASNATLSVTAGTKSTRPSPASSDTSPKPTTQQLSRTTKHVSAPIQQASSLKPLTPTQPPINSTSTPTRATKKSPAAPKDLSRLDEFLAQTKSLPMNQIVDPTIAASSSSWRTSVSIKKLFWVEACLFDLDQLCLPSELIRYTVLEYQSEPSITSSTAQNRADSIPVSAAGDAQDYKSPLTMFRSYRFSPRYQETARDGYRSLTYSHRIDPLKPMCIYELSGGSCNDDSCKSQHLRDCALTDEELVIDMARYSEGNTPETRQVFAEMQSAKLTHLRAAGIHNADLLVNSIVKSHRDFVHDPSRIVKFADRIELAGNRLSKIEPKALARRRAVDRVIAAIKYDSDPLDQNPLVISILSRTSEGTQNKNKRYHEHRTQEYYEKQLKGDASNENIWIEYVVSLLSDESLDVEDSPVQKATVVLARAITVHPRSEGLWSLYLDLYVRNGTELETRQMFEQCLLYIPDAQLVWFRYYLWEKGRDERVYVLDRMLERACQQPREEDDMSTRSRFTLDVVLQIVKIMVSEDFVESAKNWLQNFLTCASWDSIVPSSLSYAQLDDVWVDQDMVDNISGTFAARLLTPTDLCVLWLAYVYLIWFHELPEQLFLEYPNYYLSDNRLFVIQWPQTEEREQEIELFNIVHEIFLGLTSYFVDSEARPPLVTVVKNFVEFLMARGQQQAEILELVSPSQFPESLPEIRDLFCQVQMRFNQYEEAKKDLQQVIQESPTQPYLWNRYARLLPDEGKMACLEQCALEFFVLRPGDETHRSELALLLYKKLLGLELPYSYVAPPPRLDTTPFRTNIFLWLNYLSLLALRSRHDGSFVQLESAFSSALELVPVDKNFAIQTEFAVHSIMKELDKNLNASALYNIVTSAVGGVSVSRTNPYDHSMVEDTRSLPLWNFARLNRIVETVWNRTAESPRELRVDIMDVFLRLHPNDPDLYLWMGEAEELAGHANQCRKILVACLKRFPLSENVWKRFVSPLLPLGNIRIMRIWTGSMSQESIDMIMKASLLSPLAARMSKMPILRATEDRTKPTNSSGIEQSESVLDGHMSDVHEQDSDSDVDMAN